MLIPLIELVFLCFFAFCSLFVIRKIAKAVGLVDIPTGRKQHTDNVPLAGGIATSITLLYFVFNNPSVLQSPILYASCVIVLVIVGALDDKFNISYKIRLFVQALLSIAIMWVGNLELTNVGNLLGTGEINLGAAGYAVTVLAVIAAINAFNMVDGIDGLLGGLSIVTFGGLALLLLHDGQAHMAYFCFAMVAILVPYVVLNMGLLGRQRKVFMGDAGSMLIGFTVVWVLLFSSQNGKAPPLRPVTALWLIAVPLMDMVAIMIRRIRRSESPFKPDRDHLHHIFQRVGLTSKQTLLAICSISALYAGIGIYSDIVRVPEYIMLIAFLACFGLYFLLVTHIWRVTSIIRAIFTQITRKS
ncbi:UDP-N-acetylglucosamine--undecaprenyl-phosphate N-acetylglucosaminephosphotransferase [Salinivibrio kushneri]|uniref:UDP-N-acetylglucosamine--undecaprenyl-phosphate N-acetylglucosaminephosphotransferase n=1 Tax=Salinivibrio kushneri TaxID=1908198 RepID=UPI0022B40E74|nr:UDP-N-acetylglucosamine--undecaprenyl-phosphate N-acetylglucosaminephosphotransferase [Salinivibrio kushneri]WBA17141.1 UDP-N-acetylglucosamine--undecaprenyl-phosphate N-acetylglucosaminephosphotransferase [Salinivibrio kushneri]